MKDEALTIQQAANLLGVSTKTLRRWEEKGFIKPQRTVGNQRRYSKNELATLFSSEKGKGKPQPIETNIPEIPHTQIFAEAQPVTEIKNSPVVIEEPSRPEASLRRKI